VDQEGISADADAIDLIARQATGSLRDAISLLDQLSSTGEQVTRAFAEAILGTAPHEAVGGIITALAEDQVGQGLVVINEAIDRGADPRQLARQIVDYLRGLLLIQMDNADLVDRPADQSQRMSGHAEKLSRAQILRGIKTFSKVASERRTTWQSSLPLELALIDTVGQGDETYPAASSEPVSRRNKSGSPEVPSATSDPPVEATPKQNATRIKSASPPAELAGTITFEHVLGSWRDVLQAARSQDPRVQALLNSCRPLGIENGALVIGFSSDLLREKMEKEHNLRIAIAALERVFGDRLKVRCVLTETWQSGEYESAAPPPMADQGMVATALRELGAQVVDVEHVPQDSTNAEAAS
jgi:DNA polymerase-3 subunit gamma/tau